MDKESRYELQKIDCNCNDCLHMQRDFETFKKHDTLHDGKALEHRINYGNCTLLGKPVPVSFIPNTVQLHTQQCFTHRKDKSLKSNISILKSL